MDESDSEKIDMSPAEYFEWPTTNLVKAIKKIELKTINFNDPPEVPLAENAYNVTKDPSAINLASKFRPDIDLRGLELRSEKNSRRWGGILYRVISDDPNVEQSKNACIQYIHTWTEQGIFLSRWYHIFAPIMLALIGIWIYSKAFLPADFVEFAEVEDPDKWFPLVEETQDLFYLKPIPLIMIISLIILFIGIWGTFIKPRIEGAGKFAFVNSTAFILYAPIFFWTMIAAENENWIVEVGWSWDHVILKLFGNRYEIFAEPQVSHIYISSIIFVFIAVL
ncbi:MAG: hypothetical protein ACFFCQ_18505, partial [Promethearchaeota archaeon]